MSYAWVWEDPIHHMFTRMRARRRVWSRRSRGKRRRKRRSRRAASRGDCPEPCSVMRIEVRWGRVFLCRQTENEHDQIFRIFWQMEFPNVLVFQTPYFFGGFLMKRTMRQNWICNIPASWVVFFFSSIRQQRMTGLCGQRWRTSGLSPRRNSLLPLFTYFTHSLQNRSLCRATSVVNGPNGGPTTASVDPIYNVFEVDIFSMFSKHGFIIWFVALCFIMPHLVNTVAG